MAEWNRRREAADSDSEAVEQIADQRTPLNRRVDASSEVTGWNANEAMRKLRDMLFPGKLIEQIEPLADSRAEKIQQAWTSDKKFAHAARLDDTGRNPFQRAVDDATTSREEAQLVEGKDWFAMSDQRSEAMQQLDNNCVPTSVTNAMRDVLQIPVEGGQAGVTRRAMQSGWWDPGSGSSLSCAAEMFKDELRYAGREGEVSLHPEEMSREGLSSKLDSGAGVVAAVPNHCVQVTACDVDWVEVLDPWDGRLCRYTNESWASLVMGYASCELNAEDTKEAR